jgi:hypothetical protein
LLLAAEQAGKILLVAAEAEALYIMQVFQLHPETAILLL